MSSWARSRRCADSATATLSTWAVTSQAPVARSTSRIRSSPKRARWPGASAHPVGVEHAGLALGELEADRAVGRVLEQAEHGAGHRDLLDRPVASYDEGLGVAGGGDVEVQHVADLAAARAHGGHERLVGVGDQHAVDQLEDPARVAVDERGGAHGLPHLAGQHRGLDTLAADVADHGGPAVVVAVHVVEVAAEGLLLVGHPVVGAELDTRSKCGRLGGVSSRESTAATRRDSASARVVSRVTATRWAKSSRNATAPLVEAGAAALGDRQRAVRRPAGRHARWSAGPSAGSTTATHAAPRRAPPRPGWGCRCRRRRGPSPGRWRRWTAPGRGWRTRRRRRPAAGR